MVLTLINWAELATILGPLLGAVAVLYSAVATANANRLKAEVEHKLAEISEHKTNSEGWGLLTTQQQSAITQLYDRIEELQARLKCAESRSDELIIELRTAHEELAKLKASLIEIQVENERRISELEMQLTAARMDNKRMITEMFDLKRENGVLRNRLAELEKNGSK